MPLLFVNICDAVIKFEMRSDLDFGFCWRSVHMPCIGSYRSNACSELTWSVKCSIPRFRHWNIYRSIPLEVTNKCIHSEILILAWGLLQKSLYSNTRHNHKLTLWFPRRHSTCSILTRTPSPNLASLPKQKFVICQPFRFLAAVVLTRHIFWGIMRTVIDRDCSPTHNRSVFWDCSGSSRSSSSRFGFSVSPLDFPSVLRSVVNVSILFLSSIFGLH